jgi:hypothetical protein
LIREVTAAAGPFAVSLVVSFLAILVRFHPRLRPLGSLRAARWTLALMLATAAASTVGVGALTLLGTAAPVRIVASVVPASMLALGRGRSVPSAGRSKLPDRSAVNVVLTAAIGLLVDAASTVLAAERENWVAPRADAIWSSPGHGYAQMTELRDGLARRRPDRAAVFTQMLKDYADKLETVETHRRGRTAAEARLRVDAESAARNEAAVLVRACYEYGDDRLADSAVRLSATSVVTVQ